VQVSVNKQPLLTLDADTQAWRSPEGFPNTVVPKSDGYFEIAVRKVNQEILPGIETYILVYGVPGDDALFRTCNGGGLSDVPHSWQPVFPGDVTSCHRFNVLFASITQVHRIQLQVNNGTLHPFTIIGSDQG
jgi:hypothetical protein